MFCSAKLWISFCGPIKCAKTDTHLKWLPNSDRNCSIKEKFKDILSHVCLLYKLASKIGKLNVVVHQFNALFYSKGITQDFSSSISSVMLLLRN